MAGAHQRFILDEELIAFVEAGVPIIVGTCDRDNLPSVTRAWAARVTDCRGAMELFLSDAQSAACLRDLADGGQVAVTFSRPYDYRTFQLKGRCTKLEPVSDCDDDDREDRRFVADYWEALVRSFAEIGVPENLSRSLWVDGLTRITFVIERCYRQTPGPDAGAEVPPS